MSGSWLAHSLPTAALQLPASALAAAAGGLAHAGYRLARAGIRQAPSEALFLAGAGLPLAAGAALRGRAGLVALLALPFLAALAVRALLACGALLWPSRPRSLAVALGALALAPGLVAGLRAWPAGLAAWSELAGGAPGAASAGLPRLLAGDPAAELVPAISARAAPGSRIWWHGTPHSRVEEMRRQGRLRADLLWAEGPEDADLAFWRFRPDERDREYRIWSAFGTERPVEGVFVDEVPVAMLYARAGAWR